MPRAACDCRDAASLVGTWLDPSAAQSLSSLAIDVSKTYFLGVNKLYGIIRWLH